MDKSLDGLVVLEIAEGWAAPLVGRILSDLGAEVIKIEKGGGDYLRKVEPLTANKTGMAFQLTSAGKKSVYVNNYLNKNLDNIIKFADVIICDNRAKVNESDILNKNPNVIICYITPFGLTGSLSSWKATDGVLQAAGGIMATTGFPGEEDFKAGGDLGYFVGAFYGTTAILSALLYRDRTKIGQLIDISIHDCLVTYLLLWLPHYFLYGHGPEKRGNRHLIGVPWNSYRCSDGLIVLCTSMEKQWVQLCRLMERADLLEIEKYKTMDLRRDHEEEIDGLVQDWLRKFTVDEAVAKLNGIGIPSGPLCSVKQVLTGAHSAERGIVKSVPHTVEGRVLTSGALPKMSLTPGRVCKGAPVLGEHTNEILKRSWNAQPEVKKAKEGYERCDRPLDNIKFLEMANFGAGPYCGKLLAELGAEVIKIESPAGDPSRSFTPRVDDSSYVFHLYNAGKKSVVANAKTVEGHNLIKKLAGEADVFLENFAPGVMARLNLDYESLTKVRKDIVYCSVSGFGQSGLYSDRKAFDTVIQAMSGIMQLTGDKPTKIGVSAADLLGPTFATIPILASLYYRNRKGKGQYIDVSMYDVISWTTQSSWPQYWARRISPQSMGNRHPLFAPYGVYPTLGGKVFIGIERESQWNALCSILNIIPSPNLANHKLRTLNHDYLDSIIENWTHSQNMMEVINILQSYDVPVAPVWSIEEVLGSLHIKDRKMMAEVYNEGIKQNVCLTGSVFKLSKTPGCVNIGGPKLGQNNKDYA